MKVIGGDVGLWYRDEHIYLWWNEHLIDATENFLGLSQILA